MRKQTEEDKNEKQSLFWISLEKMTEEYFQSLTIDKVDKLSLDFENSLHNDDAGSLL